MAREQRGASPRREFDPGAFAALLAERRGERRWSTRELARRAGVSQPYVVSLERGAVDGPTPTVDVVARLAHALGVDPTVLFDRSLRPAGRHALLVVDGTVSLSVVQRAAASGPPAADRWVWASSSAAGRREGAGSDAVIDLRRDGDLQYRPDRIESAFGRELDAVSLLTAGHDVGFVFADTSRVMGDLDDPAVLLDFERRWAGVVGGAARRRGARAAWNVCVYRLDDLRRTHDPTATVLDLVGCHDDVWWSRSNTVTSGRSAVVGMLMRLVPEGMSARAWRTQVDGLVAGLDLAA